MHKSNTVKFEFIKDTLYFVLESYGMSIVKISENTVL